MNRYAHAIFCDDVRQELGEKMSLMGVYSGDLVAEPLPGTLPKLCAVITLVTPRSDQFRTISIAGSFLGDIVFKMELGEEDLAHMVSLAPPPSPDSKAHYIQLMALLSPFQISGPGRLEIEVIADGERLDCAGLNIKRPT